MTTKEMLKKQFDTLLEEANSDDLEVVASTLQSIEAKRSGAVNTYINGLLNYSGHMIGEESYEATIKLSPFLMNSLDILHGGITATLADTAMGTLVFHLLPEHMSNVTSEMKINYLRPGTGTHLTCRAELVHRGKSLCVISSKVLSADGRTVAYASGSFFVIKKSDMRL